MAQKACEGCGEMVDEAKAFCPGCGNPMVDEVKRQDRSEFDKLDNTVQFGQTMYNQMLSDLGLNVSKAPDVPEKRIEVLAPLAPAALPAAAEPPTSSKAQQADIAPRLPQRRSGNTKWLVLAGVVVVLGFIVVVAAVVLLYIFIPRLR